MEISKSAYARHRGLSEAAIRKAIKSGRISQTANGKIDPDMADQEWATNSNPAHSKAPLPNTEDEKRRSSSAQVSYQQSRAVHEGYNARMAKLQFEKESDQLISVEEADADLVTVAMITRDRILNIPDQLAPQLVGKTDIIVIKTLLVDALRNALCELADEYGTQAQ